MKAQYYIGMMTGTSTDGIDAALVKVEGIYPHQHLSLIDFDSVAMPADLRAEILALNYPGENELERASVASLELAKLHVTLAKQLLNKAGIQAVDVTAVGVHGQTVRHRPELGFTLQLNAPTVIAQQLGIPVVADFRQTDIALGGQGAPLAPLFHQALFPKKENETLVILNLGGIANVSIYPADREGQAFYGFDTGPANMLLDAWIAEKRGVSYDRDATWGLSVPPNFKLLDFLIQSEPWFAQKPPKSTGRDLLNLAWLEQRLAQFGEPVDDAVVMATLYRLTARTVMQALAREGVGTQSQTSLYICGGGAKNPLLVSSLRQEAQEQGLSLNIQTTDEVGIDAQCIEAMGFAYLAYLNRAGIALDMGKVTGALRPYIIGTYYPVYL